MLDTLDAAIDSHGEQTFAFLEELIRASSFLGSEQAAMDIFAREAEATGLSVQRLPFPNEPMNDPRAGISPKRELLTSDRYQVLASTPGQGEFLLLLNGHLDVVPAEAPELWTTPPFEPSRRNGRLYGRGSVDMKSGFAVGLLALKALRDVAPDLFRRRRLGFMAVLEEECTGNGTLHSIIAHGVSAQEVVVLEPTDLGLLLGGVGILWADVTVTSAAGHAHSAAGVNSVELGMRVVSALRCWVDKLNTANPEPHMPSSARAYNLNLGKVRAGDWTSSAPARATFSIRFGFPRNWTPQEAHLHICNAIIATTQADSDFSSVPELTLTGFRAKGHYIEPETPLVRDLARSHLDAHGEAPRCFMIGATSDARIYLQDFGIPAVCYGAKGGNLHGVDEYVELQSIADAARTLARFLLMRFETRGELV